MRWRILRPGEPPETFDGTLEAAKAHVESDGAVLTVRDAAWREFRPDPDDAERVYHLWTVRDSRGRFVYTINLIRK